MEKIVPEKDPTTYSLITYGWVVLLAGFGGLVNVIRQVNSGDGPSFSAKKFIGELVISCFAGLITFFLCEGAQLDPMLSAGLIGMAGHMGSRAILIFQHYLINKTKGFKR